MTRVATTPAHCFGAYIAAPAVLNLNSEYLRYAVTVAVSFVARVVAATIRLTPTVDVRQKNKNAT